MSVCVAKEGGGGSHEKRGREVYGRQVRKSGRAKWYSQDGKTFAAMLIFPFRKKHKR